MSLNVIADGRGGFRLHRAGEQIGWIEGRAIGFRGFDSAKDAHQAAGTAYGALRGWLARQRRMELLPGSRRAALQTRRDGGVTWLTLGGRAIGRIVEPHERNPFGQGGYGFELDMPALLKPVNTLSAAQVIDVALERRAEVFRLEATASAGVDTYARNP
jgi:hypothetical protein